MNGQNTGHRLCIILFLVSLFHSAGCRSVEQRVLYAPDRFPHAWNQPQSSELNGLEFEEAYFESLDGTQLHGWFIQPVNFKPGNVVLFAHGRAGNISTFKSRLFEFVRRHQVAILVFDYRGYGKSGGKPSENGLYRDVTAARDWLAQRNGIGSHEVILMGRSLGAAVVIDVAARDGAKALIVESGFTSVPDIVQHQSRNLLNGRLVKSNFDSKSKIGNFGGPVFISHGMDDRVIPHSHGVQLAEAATGARFVHFVAVEGGHVARPTPGYDSTLNKFLSRL